MIDASRPQDIFGQRAAFYTTSQTHRDPSQLRSLVALANPCARWRVLDVGTGTGHTALAFAPHVAEVVGVDVTREMLHEASTLRNASSHVVQWLQADAEALPFEGSSFDLVTCRRAAHHYVSIAQAVDEMARILKPGGRALIDDRSIPEDDAIDALLNQLDVWHDRSHVREYRASEWRHMFEERGLAVAHVEMYIQHRPLSVFAHGAEADDLAAIHARLAAASPAEREALQLEEREGETYFDNWYVVVLAEKQR